MLLLPPGVAPSSVTRLSVDVADRPGVLLRVLGICQRRGADVLAMSYAHPRIELAVCADERHLVAAPRAARERHRRARRFVRSAQSDLCYSDKSLMRLRDL